MLVVVPVVVIDVRSIVYLDVVGIVCKVVGSAGVVFAIIAHVTLNDVMDVAGAILVQLYVMTRAFLEYDDCNVDGAEDTELVCLLEKAVLTL